MVGRTIILDDTPYLIAGVMPPDFRTQFRGPARDYWTPFVTERTRDQERRVGYELIARLSPHVTIETARQEAQPLARALNHEGLSDGGEGGEGRRVLGLHPLQEEIVGTSAYALQLLFVAVAVVLSMICANLAQLLLARSDCRVREFAIRRAVGASRAQLFRLALLESLMLSGTGWTGRHCPRGTGSLPVAVALAPEEIPRLAEAAIDDRVLAVALGLALLTGCVSASRPRCGCRASRALGAMADARSGAGPRGASVRFFS